jgi:hypothetical protein
MSQFASNRAQALPQVAHYASAERTAGWLLSTLTRPDVAIVLAFCAIGLILTFAALAASPDFASVLVEESAMP